MTTQQFILRIFFVTLILASTGCVSDIYAQKYNEDGACWGPREVVGNDWGTSGCDTAMEITTDANGDYWLFSSLCLADGYDPVEDNQVRSDLFHMPHCDE